MIEKDFNIAKEDLKNLIKKELKIKERDSLLTLYQIIEGYNFGNRLLKKGALTRFIIDSAVLDYSIGEKFILFDKKID